MAYSSTASTEYKYSTTNDMYTHINRVSPQRLYCESWPGTRFDNVGVTFDTSD